MKALDVEKSKILVEQRKASTKFDEEMGIWECDRKVLTARIEVLEAENRKNLAESASLRQ